MRQRVLGGRRLSGVRRVSATAAPQITSAMVALAWCVIHCPQDGEDGPALARLIIAAAEAPESGPGRP